MIVHGMRAALLAAVLLQTVCGQRAVQSGQNGQGGPSVANIEVQCQKTGMQVQIEFSERFDGIIFSKGHFADPNCRYAGGPGRGGPGRTRTFTVPMTSCGTSVRDGTVFSNTVVLQTDPTIQEAWDLARTITCDWQRAGARRTVTYSPLPVAGMQAEEVRFAANESVSCGMDVQVGRWPQSQAVTQMVSVGSDLSLLMFAEDPAGQLDLRVGECRAYSSADFASAASVQLTDSNGCVLKQKLMTELQVTRRQLDGRDRVIAYSYLSAFKFPDVLEVHFSCDVEVCKGLCPKSCVRRDTSAGAGVTSQRPATVAVSRRPVTTSQRPAATSQRSASGSVFPSRRPVGGGRRWRPASRTVSPRRTTPAIRRRVTTAQTTTTAATTTEFSRNAAQPQQPPMTQQPQTTPQPQPSQQPQQPQGQSSQPQGSQQPQPPTKDYPTFNINTKRDFPSKNALEEGSVRTDNLLSQLANIELGRLPGSGSSQSGVPTPRNPAPRVPDAVTSRPPPGKRTPPSDLAATRVVQTPFGPVTVPAALLAGATNGNKRQNASINDIPSTPAPTPPQSSNFISFESPPAENEVLGAATQLRAVEAAPPAAIPVPIPVPVKRPKPGRGRKRRLRGPRFPFGLRGRSKRSVVPPAEIRPVRLSRQVYVAAEDELTASEGPEPSSRRRQADSICLGVGTFTAGLLVAAGGVLFGLAVGCAGCWQRRQRTSRPKLNALPQVDRLYRRAR